MWYADFRLICPKYPKDFEERLFPVAQVPSGKEEKEADSVFHCNLCDLVFRKKMS